MQSKCQTLILSLLDPDKESRENTLAFTLLFRIMQRSWLKEKPYLRVRFTQDGITSKVTDSSKLKLEEKGCLLTGSLSNYSFRIGQKVWCYWKTADEKEKSYFEGEVIEMWDNATTVEENLPISNEEGGIAEGEGYFHT